MAIAPGDTVAHHVAQAGTSAQPALFGVVSSVPAMNSGVIRWENGLTSITLTLNGVVPIIDRIDPPDASEKDRLQGRNVHRKSVPQPSQFDSPGYSGVVGRIFKRDPNGSGVGVTQVAAVKDQAGSWFEALTADLVVVPGT